MILITKCHTISAPANANLPIVPTIFNAFIPIPPLFYINDFVQDFFFDKPLHFRFPFQVFHKVCRPFETLFFRELFIHRFVQFVGGFIYAVQVFGKICNRPIDSFIFKILFCKRSVLAVNVPFGFNSLLLNLDFRYGQSLARCRFSHYFCFVHNSASDFLSSYQYDSIRICICQAVFARKNRKFFMARM